MSCCHQAWRVSRTRPFPASCCTPALIAFEETPIGLQPDTYRRTGTPVWSVSLTTATTSRKRAIGSEF
jgi:hypothetical protein